jgi:hypothetical protein
LDFGDGHAQLIFSQHLDIFVKIPLTDVLPFMAPSDLFPQVNPVKEDGPWIKRKDIGFDPGRAGCYHNAIHSIMDILANLIASVLMTKKGVDADDGDLGPSASPLRQPGNVNHIADAATGANVNRESLFHPVKFSLPTESL